MTLFYTETAFREMLNVVIDGDSPSAGSVTHVGAFDAGTPVTSITGEADTDLFTKASHGFSNGMLIKLSSLSGGTGLNVNKWYFVVGVSGDDFQLSPDPGGTAVPFSTDVTSVTMTPFIEISGGSYARQAIAFGAAGTHADGATIDDSTNGAVIPIPGGSTVSAIGGFTASTNGTLLCCDEVTEEAFAGDGTYTVTDFDATLTVS